MYLKQATKKVSTVIYNFSACQQALFIFSTDALIRAVYSRNNRDRLVSLEWQLTVPTIRCKHHKNLRISRKLSFEFLNKILKNKYLLHKLPVLNTEFPIIGAVFIPTLSKLTLQKEKEFQDLRARVKK